MGSLAVSSSAVGVVGKLRLERGQLGGVLSLGMGSAFLGWAGLCI